MLDFSLWGLNGFGYHLQNLFWHIVAVLAVYNLLILFRINPRLALLCSIFFAVHPQRAESVVWISERKDVLCAAFYLWSLLLFLLSEFEEGSSRRIKYSASIVLAIFALLSKPMAVSLPLVMFLCLLSLCGRIDKKNLIRVIPFFVISIIFIPIAVISQDIPQAHLSLFKRFAVAVLNVPWYVFKTLLPFNLAPIYPRIILSDEKILFSGIFYLIACLGILSFWIRRRIYDFSSNKLFLLLCFLASLAPVSGIVPLGAIDYADRYSYIPCIFLIIFAGCLIDKFFSDRRASKYLSIALSGYIAIIAVITYFYSYAWSSYRAVLESALSHDPPAYMALGALADLEFFNGDRDRIPAIAKIIREREVGWESKGGLERILLKADVLEMRYYYESGNRLEAAKVAENIIKNDRINLIEDQNDKDSFMRLLEQIKSNH